MTIDARLKKLEKEWNGEYMLIAANGTLMLVKISTGEILETYPKITCDGGDPDIEYKDNKEYIKW